MAQQRGFSLIETLVAVSISGVLTAVGVPAFQASVERQRLQAVAETFRNDFHLARLQSMNNGQPVRVFIGETAQGTCYAVYRGPEQSCHCDTLGNAQCTPEASVLASQSLPAQSGVRVSANVKSMLLNGHSGTVTPAATVKFETSSGTQVRHVVAMTGPPAHLRGLRIRLSFMQGMKVHQVTNGGSPQIDGTPKPGNLGFSRQHVAMRLRRSASTGFTLIEVIITVVIAGLLAAVALPSYLQFVQKGRRADAYDAVAWVQQEQERHRSQNIQYAATLTDLKVSDLSAGGHYRLSLSDATAVGYKLTVVPSFGGQAKRR